MIIVDLGVPSFLCTCLYIFIQRVGECLGDLQRKSCRFTIRLKSGGNFRANIPFLWVSSLSFSHAPLSSYLNARLHIYGWAWAQLIISRLVFLGSASGEIALQTLPCQPGCYYESRF